MVNKTKNLITEILKQERKLSSVQIMEKFEDKNYRITQDTLAKNLKEMADSGELIRHGERKKGDIAWYHYYQINENYNPN